MNSYRFVMTAIGALILGYVTPVAAKSLGWLGITSLYGAIAFGLLMLCFFVCKERVKPQPRAAEDKVTVRESLSVLAHNKYFFFLVAFFIIDFANAGLTGASGMYLARYILQDDTVFGHLNFASTFPQLLACFFFPFIMKLCKGKWNAIIFGYILYIIGYGMCELLVGTDMKIGSFDYYLMLVGSGIKGIGWGMHLVAMFAMIADVVEYGEWVTGRRLDGATYSVSSFGFKIGLGLGGAIVGWALSLVNYDATLEVQPQETLEAILNINFLLPLLLSIAGLVISLLGNLDKIHPQVMKDLTVRRAEEAAKFGVAQ